MSIHATALMFVLAVATATVPLATAEGLLKEIGEAAKETGRGVKEGLSKTGEAIGRGADQVGDDLCKAANIVRSDEKDRDCEPAPGAVAADDSMQPVPSPKPASTGSADETSETVSADDSADPPAAEPAN